MVVDLGFTEILVELGFAGGELIRAQPSRGWRGAGRDAQFEFGFIAVEVIAVADLKPCEQDVIRNGLHREHECIVRMQKLLLACHRGQ